MADISETAIDDEVGMTDTTSTGRARRTTRTSARDTVKSKLVEQRDALKGQATAKAREYAEQGKAKATDTLDGLTRFFGDTASALDKQLGPDVGEYAQRAADAVAGFTETLKQKDVEDLLDDAREAVRRNPAIAIGAAAAVGFVLVRLLKSASPAEETQTAQATPPRTSKAPRAKSSTPKASG